MRHFKLALIVTPVALILAVAGGLALLFRIADSGENVQQRAEMLGQGLGILTTVIIAPFWIYGAMKLGQERRAAHDK